MTFIFNVDYDDGKVRAKAGRPVPETIPPHRIGVMLRAGLIGPEPERLTVETYVDGYIEGQWANAVPPHVEQFAANHAAAIEVEFQRRAEMSQPRDPLDHDGDGKKGGSLPGAGSTAAKGARRRARKQP